MHHLEHALIGAGAGLAGAHILGVNPLYGIGLAVVGAGIPDIDLHWANRSYVPRPGSPCRLFEHRGPTHSLTLALMAGAALGAGTAWWIGILLAVGWLSHLAADSLSYMGVPWFWPVWNTRLRLLPYGLRIRSGTRWLELPIALGVLALSLYTTGFLDSTLSGF